MVKDSREGAVNRQNLWSSLSNRLSHPEFEEALKMLTDEMAIYSTDSVENYTIVGS